MTPRLFVQNKTLAAHVNSADRAWCFTDVQDDVECQDWVIYENYAYPPDATVQLGEPLATERRYGSRSDWESALLQTGPGALWPESGGTFVMGALRTFDRITTVNPRDYTDQVAFRTVPRPVVTPSEPEVNAGVARVRAMEIDPGDIYIFSPSTDAEVGAVFRSPNTDRVVPPEAMRSWFEFWVSLSGFEAPTEGGASLVLERYRGQPRYTDATGFLRYWAAQQANDAGTRLHVAACFSMNVPPY